MSDHTFNVEAAKVLGVCEAVFLNNIKFWTLHNLANKLHIIDRLCWTYNTHEAFTIILPYWSSPQIKRLINKLIDDEYLVKGNYNTKRYDRTGWYALLPKSYAFYPELRRPDFIDLLFNSPLSTPEPASPLIRRIRLMDKTESSNAFGGIVSPIPDSKPYNKPDIRSPHSSNDKKIDKDKIKSGFASVDSQSNSYNPDNHHISSHVSPLLAEVLKIKDKK